MKNNPLHLVRQADANIQKHFLTLQQQKLTSLDIIFKWTPLLTVFALDAFKKDRKDQLEKHLIDFAVAELLLNTTVYSLKNIFRRKRPNGNTKSFPSRHVAGSFLGSEMLRQELKDTHPVVSYSGYIVAAGTAVLRLYHNKHWLSDVLTGAAIGVLSVRLSPKLLDKVIYSTNIQAAV